jgi:hypothetical protein
MPMRDRGVLSGGCVWAELVNVSTSGEARQASMRLRGVTWRAGLGGADEDLMELTGIDAVADAQRPARR